MVVGYVIQKSYPKHDEQSGHDGGHVKYQRPSTVPVDVDVAQLTAQRVSDDRAKRVTADAKTEQGGHLVLGRPGAEQLETRADHQTREHALEDAAREKQFGVR